jgi:hypothetical protein
VNCIRKQHDSWCNDFAHSPRDDSLLELKTHSLEHISFDLMEVNSLETDSLSRNRHRVADCSN